MFSRKALVIESIGNAQVKDVAYPSLSPTRIVVRTVAVCLNPTDWKSLYLEPLNTPGPIIGCDYAGIVEEIGADVRDVKPGDRFAGFVHGAVHSNHSYGAFSSHVLAFPELGFRIPDSIGAPPEEAPTNSGEFILIYSEASATGALAIQFARLSGLRVITTCSPSKFEMVKALGAEAAWDYMDPSAVNKIKEYTNSSLEYAFDCISTVPTMSFCISALASGGKVVSTLRHAPEVEAAAAKASVTATWVLSYAAVGEVFTKGPQTPLFPPKPQDKAFAAKWWKIAAKAIELGSVKASEIQTQEGGLAAVSNRLEMLKNGFSGTKLVYRT